MKSESNARPAPAPAPQADAFRAFFDSVERPAALCDAQLLVLVANPAFEALCGTTGLQGQALTSCLSEELEVPGEGASLDVEVECRTGQRVTLTLSRRGETVAVLARALSAGAESLAASGRALAEQAQLEQALLQLGRSVAEAGGEEELVASVARGIKGLFPGRAFSVRIIDPRTAALTSLYAEGRLRDGVRDVLVLKRSMVEKTHLRAQALPAERVQVTANDLPLLFQGTVRGIGAPLAASGQLFGAINVEYPQGLTADLVADERVLIQAANQVAVAVRNAKLIDELQFMRTYLEDLLEHANALILVADRAGRVVVFNRRLAELTGLPKVEVLGHALLELVPDGEKPKLTRAVDSVLRGEPVEAVETALKVKGGKEARVAFATSAVLTQSGEVEGVIAIGQDLTRMRELEGVVVQAEKLATLGQLAAGVVHEINNPMTAVVTYADALLKRAHGPTPADPADVEKYRKILDNAERVLRFTHDLVSYARPAKEKAEDVELSVVLDRAVGFCDHLLVRHGVRLEKRYAKDVPRFVAVKQNLVQVLVNLITNACHATAAGGVVTVASELQGDHVEVSVHDTGVGIAPEVLSRIFEPFFSTKPDGKGTGLGLSIVQGIVERHGGTIAVESAPGAGTTFRVRIPLGSRAHG